MEPKPLCLDSCSRSGLELAALAISLAFFLVVVLSSSPGLSPAFDEPNHIRSGMTMLSLGRYVDEAQAWWTKLDPLHPPFDALAALFAMLSGKSADYRLSPHTPFRNILYARAVNHITGVLIALLVYAWAKALWGAHRSFFSLFLMLLNPLFVAHSTIVSSDLYGAFGGLLVLFYFHYSFLTTKPRGLHQDPTYLKRSLILGLLVSFALLCKLSNIILLILLIPFYVLCVSTSHKHECSTPSRPCLFPALGMVLLVLFSLLPAALLYQLFQGALVRPILPSWPLPFETGRALANALYVASGLGQSMPPVYFAGKFESGGLLVYLAMIAARTPVPLLVLFLLTLLCSMFLLFHKRESLPLFFVIFCSLALFVMFSTRGFYLGTRHLLLPICLFSVLGGSIAEGLSYISGRIRILAAALLCICFLLAACELLAATPLHLSYINQLGRKRLTFLADADWGQGLFELKKWQQAHSSGKPIWLSYFGNVPPESYGINYRGLLSPMTPQTRDRTHRKAKDPGTASGLVAISANNLTGRFMSIAGEPASYYHEWLAEKPAAEIANSILVYDLRGKETGKR